MIALAVVLLVLAAALVVGVVGTGTSQQVLFDSTVGSISTQPVWIFVAGVVATLLALLGLSLLSKGTRRRVNRRREMKRLRQVEKEQAPRRDAEAASARRDDAAGTPGAPVGDRRAAREGYDEPDRRLVREPRTSVSDYDPEAGEHLPRNTSQADTAGSTAGASQDPVTLDEPARHRHS